MSHHLFLGRVVYCFYRNSWWRLHCILLVGNFFIFLTVCLVYWLRGGVMVENFKLLTRQHWLKFQLTPSIYINIDLLFLVDWALLPLSTSTLVPLLVAGNCLPYHQLEFLAIYGPWLQSGTSLQKACWLLLSQGKGLTKERWVQDISSIIPLAWLCQGDS